MHFTRFWSIVETNHDIQNPSTPYKLDKLIDTLQVQPGQHVLDVGCGKGWLLTRMAERCGITGTGVEINPWFVRDAVARTQRAGVSDTITIYESDAKQFTYADQHYDAGLCIGATFALGGLDACLATLRRSVKSGGLIAIGDVFRYHDQLPAELSTMGDVPTLAELVEHICGSAPALGLWVANTDDWDNYESMKWRAAHAWTTRNADDPEFADFQQLVANMRNDYLTKERAHIGWAIVVTINE
jgi:cyclopropane fatty-acyl-phospholipid synthase-like methyltransferase